MSQSLAATATDTAAKVPIKGRPGKLRAGRKQSVWKISLSPAIRAALESMVLRGVHRAEAAREAGISDSYFRAALTDPVILTEYNRLMQMLRTSARPRAFKQIEVLSESADTDRVKLEACKYLDTGDQQRPGIQVNVGINVAPGYMVDVTGRSEESAEIARLAGSTRNVLDDK